jgi:hypothetical protein
MVFKPASNPRLSMPPWKRDPQNSPSGELPYYQGASPPPEWTLPGCNAAPHTLGVQWGCCKTKADNTFQEKPAQKDLPVRIG